MNDDRAQAALVRLTDRSPENQVAMSQTLEQTLS